MPAPPRPPPPDRSVRVVFEGHNAGAPWANVMWLYLTGSGEITHDDLRTLAQDCYDSFSTYLLPLMHNALEFSVTTVTLFSDGGDARQAVFEEANLGSHAGSSLPANCACCVSWHIAPSYRGGHARTYLTGFRQQDTAAINTWNATFLGTAREAATNFHNTLEAIHDIGDGIATVEHGIVSFVRAGAWRTPPVFYRIDASTIDQRIDTQRRRLGRDTA